MEDDDNAALSVGFKIDFHDAAGQLRSLDDLIGKTAADTVRQFQRIEAATKGSIDLGSATARVTSFANAATRAEQTIRREKAQTEKQIEGFILALDRETAAVGRSRAEQRAARMEEAAARSMQQGNTEVVERLRASQAALASAQTAEAAKVAAAREVEAQALRSAAVAYGQFEAAAWRGMETYREQQAADRAAEKIAASVRERAMAEAAVNAQLMERSRIEAALERNTGVGRVRATDAGATFSALAAKAAEDEARASAVAAAETRRLAEEHDRLAAAVRGSHAAQIADVEAAERLRLSTDPLYAATKRLNDEIALSTQLYHAGVTAPAEYARQQDVLAGRLREVERNHGLVDKANGTTGTTSKLAAHHTQNLAFQFQDLGVQMAAAAGSSEPLKMAMMALLQQGSQIQGIMSQAGIGVGGLARHIGGLLLRFSPFIAAAGAAYGAVQLVTSALERDAGLDAYAKTLGLTKDEMKKLGDVGITMGDIFSGIWTTLDAGDGLSSYITKIKQWWGEARDFILSAMRATAAGIYAGFAGAYRAVVETWRHWPAALADLFTQAANGGLAAIEKLLNASISAVNFAAKKSNDVFGTSFGMIGNVQIGRMANNHAGAASKVAGAAMAAVQEEYARADRMFGTIGANIEKAARGRIRKEADEISADRRAREAEAARKKALQEQEKAAREAAAALRELQSLYEQMQGRFDPIGAAGREYSEALANIEKLRKPGMLNEDQATSWQFAASREAAERAAKAVEDVASGIADLPKVTELEFRIVGLEPLLGLRDAETWDGIAQNVSNAARGMADAFGSVGRAIGDTASIYAGYEAQQARLDGEKANRLAAARDADASAGEIQRINDLYAIRNATAQVGLYGDMAQAARGFFKEGSSGYKAMGDAVKVFRAVEFALSVRAIAQDAIETGSKIASGAARIASNAVEAVSRALASLPFPANIAAGAATVAALAAIGVSVVGAIGGGGRNTLAKPNDGTGTVLGDPAAKSESIRRAVHALKEVDTLTLNTSREMLSSLRAIETSIGGVASLVVRAGNVNADVNVAEGFQKNLIGSVLSKIPLIGGFLGGLFGSKTEIVGGGLYGGAQSLGSILDRGFDASYYSDTKKTSKFLGITTGTSYKTSYTGADAGLESQFTLILKQFNDAITAAAGPLGASTNEIETRLRGFVVNIGKIDLKGLTGAEIEEKLSAVFGAAADQMAAAAAPGLARFQKVGEGTFETLVRVASTVEAVTASLDALGYGARALGIDAKMGIAAQFDSVSAMSSAVQAYADAFYTREEQAAAKQAQLASVFSSLGMVMPTTLAGFRQLVDAQDLTSTAGQKTYATLIQLAPAFAELKSAMEGAKSAADILAERQDLERKLLELRGDTAAIRALDLAKLDASNRALQEQVWAVQDAMDAAKAADELRQAWTSVGDSIMDEVKRIRGLNGSEGGSFASLMGEFNAASTAARAGDQEAAKSLPGISQALLNAAALVATSRQELDRVQAQTAASLEATYKAIQAMNGGSSTVPTAAVLAAAATAQAASSPAAANDDSGATIDDLRGEIADLRTALTDALASIAGNTGRTARIMEDVTAQSGGDAISVVQAAA